MHFKINLNTQKSLMKISSKGQTNSKVRGENQASKDALKI